MADAIPVSKKTPKTAAEQAAADQKAVEAAQIPTGEVHEDLVDVVKEARSAGKNVIVYSNAVRVDN